VGFDIQLEKKRARIEKFVEKIRARAFFVLEFKIMIVCFVDKTDCQSFFLFKKRGKCFVETSSPNFRRIRDNHLFKNIFRHKLIFRSGVVSSGKRQRSERDTRREHLLDERRRRNQVLKLEVEDPLETLNAQGSQGRQPIEDP